MTWNDLTSFDYIVALILLLALIRGMWIGFVRQLATAAALVGSYWLASQHIALVMPYAQQVIDQPGLVFLASFAGLLLTATLLITLIGNLLHRFMEASLLGWLNRFAGGLLGAARGAMAAVLLHMLLASPLLSSAFLFQDSVFAPHLRKGAELLRQLIQDAKVRNDLRPQKEEEADAAQPIPLPEEKLEQAQSTKAAGISTWVSSQSPSSFFSVSLSKAETSVVAVS